MDNIRICEKFKAKDLINDNIVLFVDIFWKNRNEIFEYIYNILENEDNKIYNDKIQEIIKENTDIKNKIFKIKKINQQKYIKNFKKYYKKNNILKQYGLGLAYDSYNDEVIELVYFGRKNDINNNNKNIKPEKKENTINEKIFDSKDIVTDSNENKIKDNEIKYLFKIDFIVKIKINDDDEWICNSEYALYLIYYIKNLSNPHPTNIEELFSESDDEELKSDSESSSYSISNSFDIEHLIFITNNKNNKQKKIIEIEENLELSTIIGAIRTTDYPNFNKDFIKKYIDTENIEKDINDDYNIELEMFLNNLHNFTEIKSLLFQNNTISNNIKIIKILNDQYKHSLIRFLYLNINALDKIKSTYEKRKFLSYFIARIYDFETNFDDDFEEFVKNSLKNIREKNFIINFIYDIIRKNNSLIKENEENYKKNNFFIIIDNIDSEKNFKIFETILKNNYDYIQFLGIMNMDSEIGKEKFFSLINKKYHQRREYIKYINSNNNNEKETLEKDLNNFFIKNGDKINIIKEFIQLIYFKKFIDECDNIDYKFLGNYMEYINLKINEANINDLNIIDVEFKSKEIEDKFILNYKNILLSYLNDDINLSKLFSEVNGFFFEKQIILDILLDKIKGQNEVNLNIKELQVKSIYCMNFDINKIDISQYTNRNILLTQASKTGEIYDFAIIVGNNVKLYQVSIKKEKKDLLKLNRELIEVDCEYMMNTALNKIGKYENFNFGIITSKNVFDEYEKLDKENEIKQSSYYLMKEYCNKNKYELLIYDLSKKELYIEVDSKKLQKYENFYLFQNDKKLVLPNINNIFSFNPKKNSIKLCKKENFITKLNKTDLFNIDNTNSMNIIGKFDYNENFLNIEEIKKENYGIYISGKRKKGKKGKGKKEQNIEIIKFGDLTISQEVKENDDRIEIEKNETISLQKKGAEVILFSLEDKKKFIGKKRKMQK